MTTEPVEYRELYGYELPTENLISAEVERLLKQGKAATEIALLLISLFEEMAEKLAKSDPPHRPLACAAGCDHCCHQPVGLTIPELELILAHLREHWSEADLESLKERLAQQNLVIRTIALDIRRAVHPCGFLKDGLCSIYSVRPIICRGFQAVDAHLCETSLKDLGSEVHILYYHPYTLANRFRVGILRGYQSAMGEPGDHCLTIELEKRL